MSERTPITMTREYLIAHATPITEEEKEFVGEYKSLYDEWRADGGNYDSIYRKALNELDDLPKAEAIYDREHQKQMDKFWEEWRAEEDARFDAIKKENAAKYEAALKRRAENDAAAEKKEEQQPKKQVGKAIVWSLLLFVMVAVIFLISVLVLSLLFGILFEIPIIDRLLSALLHLLGWSDADLFIRTIGVAVSYLLSTYAVLWLGNLNDPTEKLMYKIVGITVLAVHAISLISNLILGDNVWLNIVQLGIAGRYLYMSREN